MSAASAHAATPGRVRQDHKPGFVQLALGLIVLVLIGALALTAHQPQMPAIAEFAPQVNHLVTTAPAEQGGTFGGTGNAPGGAVAQALVSALPSAAPGGTTGRILHCVGVPPRQTEDPQSPPCVLTWTGDNHGATSKGVSGDTITVYAPLPTTQAGGDGTERPMMQAFERYFNDRYEFYGRKIHLVIENAGQDASADGQRAAAVHVDKEVGAFASTFWQYSGGNEFYPALAQHKIIGSMGEFEMQYDSNNLRRMYPYIWSYLMSTDQQFASMGDWVCRRLNGQKAVHAVDPSMRLQPRKFGVFFDPTTAQDPLNMPSIQPLIDQLTACLHYKPDSYSGTDWNGMFDLQAKGVNSMICMCLWSVHAGMEQYAKEKGYLPEWLLSSFELNDYNGPMKLAVNYGEPASYPSAFGLIFRPRQVAPAREPFYQALASQGITDGVTTDTLHVFERREFYRSMLLLASGIQMAGPNLTAVTFADGLRRAQFPNPADDANPGKVGFIGNSSSMTLDGAEWWWSDSAKSPYPGDTPGTFCYVNGGERHSFGNWPTGGDPFFPANGTCDSG